MIVASSGQIRPNSGRDHERCCAPRLRPPGAAPARSRARPGPRLRPGPSRAARPPTAPL